MTLNSCNHAIGYFSRQNLKSYCYNGFLWEVWRQLRAGGQCHTLDILKLINRTRYKWCWVQSEALYELNNDRAWPYSWLELYIKVAHLLMYSLQNKRVYKNICMFSPVHYNIIQRARAISYIQWIKQYPFHYQNSRLP